MKLPVPSVTSHVQFTVHTNLFKIVITMTIKYRTITRLANSNCSIIMLQFIIIKVIHSFIHSKYFNSASFKSTTTQRRS